MFPIFDSRKTDSVVKFAPRKCLLVAIFFLSLSFVFFLPDEHPPSLQFPMSFTEALSKLYPSGFFTLNPVNYSNTIPQAERSSNEINIDLYPGDNNRIWGVAAPNGTITVQNNGAFLFSAFADPACGGCWENPSKIIIEPGDVITILTGYDSSPFDIEIPNPFTVQADSLIDEVWGQVGNLSGEHVVLDPEWEEAGYEVWADEFGNYIFELIDIPFGGRGKVIIIDNFNSTIVRISHYFQTPDIVLDIHFGQDWISGQYDPGHIITIEVFDNIGSPKAETSIETGPIDQWQGASGFATYLDSVEWSPSPPDLVPGDLVHVEVDDGSLYWTTRQIGQITVETDLSADLVTGYVDADWYLPGPINALCEVWDGSDASVSDEIIPNGEDEFECDFSGIYDLVPGTPLMVMYQTNKGNVIGSFQPPAPYLRIEKYFIGEGSPGAGGNVVFYVQYQNQGELPAEDVMITDEMIGMTYLSDTSGLTPIIGPGEVSWDLGTVDPGDWISFIVFAQVTEPAGQVASNLVEITTSNPYDMGEPWEKISFWEDTIIENDTHVSVEKESWTQNPAPGGEFVYQISICNNGATGSSIVTAVDDLPTLANLLYWWSDSPGWVQTDIGTTFIELAHPSIAPGTCSNLFLACQVNPSAIVGQELLNHVEIHADNDLSIDDNSFDVLSLVGNPISDLFLSQDVDSGSFKPGETYRINIFVENTGNQELSGPHYVTYTYSTETSLVDWESWGYANVALFSIGGNSIEWDVDCDFPGSAAVIQVEFQVDPSAVPDTALEHTAQITEHPSEISYANNYFTLIEFVEDENYNLFIPIFLR